jgi:hypothetical protein
MPEIVSSSVDGYRGVVGWKAKDGKIERNINAFQGFDIIADSVARQNNIYLFTNKQKNNHRRR